MIFSFIVHFRRLSDVAQAIQVICCCWFGVPAPHSRVCSLSGALSPGFRYFCGLSDLLRISFSVPNPGLSIAKLPGFKADSRGRSSREICLVCRQSVVELRPMTPHDRCCTIGVLHFYISVHLHFTTFAPTNLPFSSMPPVGF